MILVNITDTKTRAEHWAFIPAAEAMEIGMRVCPPYEITPTDIIPWTACLDLNETNHNIKGFENQFLSTAGFEIKLDWIRENDYNYEALIIDAWVHCLAHVEAANHPKPIVQHD